ncbi:hypothetical protein HIM_02800 [Hirsutella minnesotensis 3608]|nr:hypothetical protein HIM_02800 [Hirsutella minnesotensis 3608]
MDGATEFRHALTVESDDGHENDAKVSPILETATIDVHVTAAKDPLSGSPRPESRAIGEENHSDKSVKSLEVNDTAAPSPHKTNALSSSPGAGKPAAVSTTSSALSDFVEHPSSSRFPQPDPSALASTVIAEPSTSNGTKMSVRNGAAATQASVSTKTRTEPTSQFAPSQSTHAYHAPLPRRRPSALDYLMPDSPTGTPRAPLETPYNNPAFGSHHTMGFANVSAPSALAGHHGDLGRGRPLESRAGVDWSSGYSGPGGIPSRPAYQRPQAFTDIYGSPPIAHSHAPLSNAPLSQAAPSVHHSGYCAEKPPMSGYQLLAAKLVGGLGGPPVTPMYRRFEALSHRLLLYMQADLMELENDLRILDAKDTMDRGYGIVPASRRHERWLNSALTQQRTEILGQIGYKLSQYNNVMASFRKTQEMPFPSLSEIHDYKLYLANSRLVADEETRFLDMPEDLVSVARAENAVPERVGADEGTKPAPRVEDEEVVVAPPIPMPRELASVASSVSSAKQHHARGHESLGGWVSQLALAMCVAFFVPVVTFAVIPDFAGRITVVALVGSSVATALMQSGLVRLLDRGVLDWFLCAGAYGATMAIVAGILL